MIVSIEVDIPDGSTIDATIGITTYLDDEGGQHMAVSRSNCGTVTNAVDIATRAAYAFCEGEQ